MNKKSIEETGSTDYGTKDDLLFYQDKEIKSIEWKEVFFMNIVFFSALSIFILFDLMTMENKIRLPLIFLAISISFIGILTILSYSIKSKNKIHFKIKVVNTFLIIAILIIFFSTRSCNKYYDLLSSKNTTVSIANVFDSYSFKGKIIYKYIYKVRNEYYVGHTNRADYINHDGEIQSFYIIYRKDNPQTNVLIYQKKIKSSINLDTIIESKTDLIKMIKYNTYYNGEGNSSDLNQYEDIKTYLYKKKSLQ